MNNDNIKFQEFQKIINSFSPFRKKVLKALLMGIQQNNIKIVKANSNISDEKTYSFEAIRKEVKIIYEELNYTKDTNQRQHQTQLMADCYIIYPILLNQEEHNCECCFRNPKHQGMHIENAH